MWCFDIRICYVVITTIKLINTSIISHSHPLCVCVCVRWGHLSTLSKLQVYNGVVLTIVPGFPGSSTGKESACKVGDPGSIPGSRRSPGEGIGYPLQHSWASLMAQMVKDPPSMQETSVWSLGWEDPLEEDMATHSSILAWKVPIDGGAWQATVHGVTESWTGLSDWAQHNTAVVTCCPLGLQKLLIL